MVLVAVVLVPAIILAGWLLLQSAQETRRQIETLAEQQSHDISAVIDREIVGLKGTVTALATSNSLRASDLATFYRKAKEVAQLLDTQVILADMLTNKQVFNTAIPMGEPLGPPLIVTGERRDEILRATAPIVSDLLFGPRIKRHVIAVTLPVMIDDVSKYALTMTLRAESIAQIAEQTGRGLGFVTTIIDRNRVVIARSKNHLDFVGKTVPDESTPHSLGLSGSFQGKNLESIPFKWFYLRSSVTGWLVVVGVPESVLNAQSNSTLRLFAGGGILFLSIAFGMAYVTGGHLSRSLGALGIDRPPTRTEFQILFDTAPNGVLVVDGQGRIVLVNERMETYFGYTREEMIGRSVETLLPESRRAGHVELRDGFAARPQSRPMGIGRELFGRRKDGSEFPIEIGLNPITTTTENLVMATVVDITKRKQAADRLSDALGERDDLLRRLTHAQEEERLRLARELHDQVGQNLTGVMLALKIYEASATEDGRKQLGKLREQMELMGRTLHRVAWELRPASIDELGFSEALSSFLTQWSEQYGIETDFECNQDNLNIVSTDIRTAVYRIVQEALTNVAKHALRASTVSIVVDVSKGVLHLTIEDDGCGFDMAQEAAKPNRTRRGLGLAVMRERLLVIGGEIEIESSVGIGTTIFARVPIEQKRMTD